MVDSKMIMLKIKRWVLTLLLVVGLGSSLGAPIVLAQTTQQGQTQTTSGQGLEISPPLIEKNADPGEQLTFDIKLRNVTTTTVIAKASTDDFTAQNEETGNPRVLTDPNETSPYTIKPWVKTPEDVRITPQQQVTQKVTVNVPKDASPGSHFGVVRFTATPEGLDSNGVALSASIGTLVFITVSGDAKESSKIEEFYVSQKAKKGSFFEYGPVNFTERINNDGNVHIKPVGDVIIKNIFGKQVASLKVNDPARNILPGTVRKFEQELNKKSLFGRYKATVTLLYGSSNKSMSQTIYFWVIPWKLVAIILIGLILLGILLRITLKRYKKRVIAKSQNQKNNNTPPPPQTPNPPQAPPTQPQS